MKRSLLFVGGFLLIAGIGCSDAPTAPPSALPGSQYAKANKLAKAKAKNLTVKVGVLAAALPWEIDVAYCDAQGFDVDHTFTVSFEVAETKDGVGRAVFEWYEDGDESQVYSYDYVDGSAFSTQTTIGAELAYQQNAGHLDDVYNCFHTRRPDLDANRPWVLITERQVSGEEYEGFAAMLTTTNASAALWLDILDGKITFKP
jgi:hypothetical protein